MTRRRVVTTRRADEDIDHALASYLDDGAEDAALRFVDALESAKDLLSAHPLIGSPDFAVETGIAELRGFSLQRFPYVILYTNDADAVRFHRILHTRRDIPPEFRD